MAKPVAITSALLGLGATAFATAIALPFDDRVEFRAHTRIDSKPAWLVPQKAEFLGIQRGYGGLKILAAIAGTTAMGGVMVISRKQAAREPVRQRVQGYRNQVEEFSAAAESAYQMALTQQRYKTLLEADQVAFEGQIETAYIESMGVNPEQPALPSTSLDQTINPGDKVRDAEAKPAIHGQGDASEPTSTPASNGASHGLPNLTWYPSVLVYGAPGAGKTTFTENEIQQRIKAGHKVIVLDPHAAYGAWKGCLVVGGGMNYAAIDAKLKWFADEVQRRYQIIQKDPNPKFQPLTFVCDEFTNWASRCENSAEFFQTVVTDIRKAEMFALIVSHSRTLAGLGDAKGMAKLRDEALLEIELLGQQDPVTGKAVPRFEALIKLPGQSLSDRTLVKIPRRSEPPQQSGFSLDAARNWLESTWSMPGVEPPTREPSELPGEPLNRPEDKDSGDSGQRFTPLNLTREQTQALINQLRTELNQTQIIERLWACKKGGSVDWKAAHAQFKELMGEP